LNKVKDKGVVVIDHQNLGWAAVHGAYCVVI
jgi:hypothetical protein